MLVKRSIVEKWYQRDSWVYKNFAFLFQNPLWVKAVPQGFTVCPYFWMSLFSLIIFRPLFVAPIHFLFLPIIRGIGKPAIIIDKWLYNTLHKFNLVPSGMGTGAGIFCSLIATGVIAVVSLLVIGIIQFYSYITISTLGTFAFWSAATFLSLSGIIGLHKKITNTECQTIYYLFAWLVVDIICMFIFVPSELGVGTKNLWQAVKEVVATIGGAIWEILKFLGHWLHVIFGYAPFGTSIPWWGYILGFTVFAWVLTMILNRLNFSEPKFNPTETDEERQTRNRNAWNGLFLRTLMVNKYWREGQVMTDRQGSVWNFFTSRNEALAASEHCMVIYKKAIEIFFGEELNKLQASYPIINPDMWEGVRSIDSTEGRFERLRLVVPGYDLPYFFFTNDKFRAAVIEALKVPEIGDAVKQLAALYDAEDERKLKRQAAKKNTWSHRMCLKVTGALRTGFFGIGRGCKTAGIQSWTFLVYLWMLIKAKKQGACPYFPFTDGEIKK